VDEAIDGYRRILALAPDHPLARYNLGLAYARSGLDADAAAEIARAIADGMAGAAAWNNLGLAHERSGQPEAAAAAYRQAVQLDPAYCFAWINLGRLHLATRDPQRARQALDVARAGACGNDLNELIDVYLDIAASGGT